MIEDDETYYYFEIDGTLGYVWGSKAKRMIKSMGWKRKQFVEESKLKELFK